MDAKSYSLLHTQLCGVTSTGHIAPWLRAQPEHTQHGHAQQAGARARTLRRQTARAHRAHSTGTQACAAPSAPVRGRPDASGARGQASRRTRARPTGRRGPPQPGRRAWGPREMLPVPGRCTRDAAAGRRGAPDASSARGQASRRACARPTRGRGRTPPAALQATVHSMFECG